jgi:hypothetical protein
MQITQSSLDRNSDSEKQMTADRAAQIAARRLAERFSLPMPVAILIADLAGLGQRDAEVRS